MRWECRDLGRDGGPHVFGGHESGEDLGWPPLVPRREPSVAHWQPVEQGEEPVPCVKVIVASGTMASTNTVTLGPHGVGDPRAERHQHPSGRRGPRRPGRPRNGRGESLQRGQRRPQVRSDRCPSSVARASANARVVVGPGSGLCTMSASMNRSLSRRRCPRTTSGNRGPGQGLLGPRSRSGAARSEAASLIAGQRPPAALYCSTTA